MPADADPVPPNHTPSDPACLNCGKSRRHAGHIYWPLLPALFIWFGVPTRRAFCADCAATMNGIGMLATIAAGVLLIAGLAALVSGP